MPNCHRSALVVPLLPSLLLLQLAGCTPESSSSSVRSVDREAAMEMEAKRDPFSASADPPLKKDTHLAAGLLAESRGQLAEAGTQYELALKQDPNDVNGLYRLGIVRTQLRQEQAAIDAWTRYVDATDGTASAYANLGVCYDSFGRFEQAGEAFKSGIARDPRNEACRVNYGLMLARRGLTAEATAQLSAVLPTAQVHYNLGSAHEQMGRRREALAEFAKALAAQPDFHAARTRYDALKDEGAGVKQPK